MPLDIVLLPGLDGTGRLFKPFLDVLPPSFKPTVISYPTDAPCGYADLETLVEHRLPKSRRFAIIAESFSGPVAVRLATKGLPNLAAVVLVGSFVRRPIRAIPPWIKLFIGSGLFSLPPPAWALRRFLAGPDASDELVSEVRAALRLVQPRVLAHRVREALAVDAAEAFACCPVPMLYLAGTRDRLLAPTIANTLRELCPNIEISAIEAPHFILQRCPKEAAKVITAFFARRRTF